MFRYLFSSEQVSILTSVNPATSGIEADGESEVCIQRSGDIQKEFTVALSVTGQTATGTRKKTYYGMKTSPALQKEMTTTAWSYHQLLLIVSIMKLRIQCAMSSL